MNILSQNASTVGSLDLKLMNYDDNNNFIFFDKLKNKEFKFLYLLSSDNLDIVKNNEFVVYQGSHGDRGAEIADVILPSPAYTEQNGLYSNLEGRIQECRKASYPTGDSKEDWKIFNLLSDSMHNKKLFNSQSEISELALTLIPNFSSINSLPNRNFKNSKKKDVNFFNEKITIKPIDYYFTNSISRSSKTMAECRVIKKETLKMGTNN